MYAYGGGLLRPVAAGCDKRPLFNVSLFWNSNFKWLAKLEASHQKKKNGKKRTILHGHLTKVRVERYLNIKKKIGKKKTILHRHLTKVRVERYLNI